MIGFPSELLSYALENSPLAGDIFQFFPGATVPPS